ncbi:hypothetical protein J6590_042227 [Homalodisca vitripennis]|nr:hypothetical protein J6590_042227 [Homalodisca vitripennis]
MKENEEPCLRNSEIDRIILFDVTDGMAENSEEEGDTDAEDTPLHTSIPSFDDDNLDPDFMPEADNLFGDRLDYSEEEISSDGESELAADEFFFDKSSQNPNLFNSFEFSQFIGLKEEIDLSSPLNIFFLYL